MLRVGFNEKIKDLNEEILRMGSMAERQIRDSIEALCTQNANLAKKLIDRDDDVDNMEKLIEEKALKLIALEQPVARDLREVFTATKIATDIERIADHAVDIAKITIRLKDEEYIKKLIDIPRISNIANSMLIDSLDAYLDKDQTKAYEVCKRDDEIDGIYKQVFSELLIKMMENPKCINQASQFLFVCKYLERIADHITNICEWIVYLKTGELIDLNN